VRKAYCSRSGSGVGETTQPGSIFCLVASGRSRFAPSAIRICSPSAGPSRSGYQIVEAGGRVATICRRPAATPRAVRHPATARRIGPPWSRTGRGDRSRNGTWRNRGRQSPR
jgi:hypothetical protein